MIPGERFPWGKPTREVRFVVPLVRGKIRHRSGKGRMYTPARTVADEALVARIYAGRVRRLRPAPAGVPVGVEVAVRKRLPKTAPRRVAAMVDLTRPDLDNVEKLVMDALNGVAYEDDRQVSYLLAWRGLRRRRQSDEMEISVTVPLEWDPETDGVRLEGR